MAAQIPSDFDISIAARTIWSEARGEPEEGQKAVAHVLINRLKSQRWSRTLAGVCLFRLQFSCWNQDDVNRLKMVDLPETDESLVKFKGFIKDAQSQEDIIDGAMFYYSVSIPPPTWVKDMIMTKQIGNHKFYKDHNA